MRKPQHIPSRPDGLPDDGIAPCIEFRSDEERRFAQFWAATYPQIDLAYEYRFMYPSRKTVDFAHLPTQCGIEIQGGVWVSGLGHSSGKGITADYRKITDALKRGWVIIPVAAGDIENGEKIAEIAQIILTRMAA
jgi:hypothetical protein